MTPEELIALAERCEAAGAGEQEELLEYAWLLVNCEHETPDDSDEMMGLFDRLRAMLAVEAYESAALMLVPEGKGFVVMGNGAKVGGCIAASSTPALAIVAAALRARAGERE